jgi:hypothetical protein
MTGRETDDMTAKVVAAGLPNPQTFKRQPLVAARSDWDNPDETLTDRQVPVDKAETGR